MLTKFVYINSKKICMKVLTSHAMCTNQVILSKITTEPPKTKQKFELWSTSLENGRENIGIL